MGRTRNVAPDDYDFSGWATKYDVKCDDGRTIAHGAFDHFHGRKLALVWHHKHDEPSKVLGHVITEARDQGLYAYGKFNGTPNGVLAHQQVNARDLDSLSIWANKLTTQGPLVKHGTIREVSLVLSGANNEAKIDVVMAHDGYGEVILDDEGHEVLDHIVVFGGERIEMASTSDTGGSPETVGDIVKTFSKEELAVLALMLDVSTTGSFSESDEEGSTEINVKDVLDGMSDEKAKTLYYLVGKANADVQHDFQGEEDMKQNLWDEEETEVDVLSHDGLNDILGEVVSKNPASLKDAFIAHASDSYGIAAADIGKLFPDGFTDVNGQPQLIERDKAWVKAFFNKARHVPYSRIKSRHSDITVDEARAKGYVTTATKDPIVHGMIKRTTTPTTVYIKGQMDHDDVLDITDIDILMWQKSIMREQMFEEISRAALITDGRAFDHKDKINEANVRPIYGDDELYVHNLMLTYGDDIITVIDAVAASSTHYKGSGNPTLFCTAQFRNDMLLKRDADGHRLHKTIEELKAALLVGDIQVVEVMDNVTRTDVDLAVDVQLLGIIVNPKDYTFGADKGGKTEFFDDFDLDVNLHKFLYETRISAALTEYKSAIVIEVPLTQPA